MDQEACLATDESYATTNDSDDENRPQITNRTNDSFSNQWNAATAGTALFAPTDLPLSKPLRAYERQPKSPFARRKVRFSKIYKRNNAGNTNQSFQSRNGSAGLRTPSGMTLAGLQSPMKAVKKLCLSSDYGPTSQVSSWEARGSPARKIRTRSTVQTEELVELPEELDTVDSSPELATFEVVDESGETIETVTEHNDDWEDEDSAVGAESESMLLHTGEPVDATQREPLLEKDGDKSAKIISTSNQDTTPQHSSPHRDQDKVQPETIEEHEPAENSEMGQRGRNLAATRELQPSFSSAPLPAGFVSPVKRRRTVKERMNASSYGSRRRTLPVEFAPAISGVALITTTKSDGDAGIEEPFRTVVHQQYPADELSSSADDLVDTGDYEKYELGNEPDERCSTASVDAECSENAEIRDTAEHFDSPDLRPTFGVRPQEESVAKKDHGGTSLPNTFAENTLRHPAHKSTATKVNDQATAVHEVDDTDLESNNRSKQHSPLAIRRSPRRKSTSPPKKFTVFSTVEKPHLVACTPIKRPSGGRLFAMAGQACDEETKTTGMGSSTEQDALLQRSASAPPEDPVYASPKRQPKPRVSDDTALLQAFLDRAAAERKTRRSSTGRKLSISKRESIENRRDSGTVREALAANPISPPEMRVTDGILTDRDINSPSPKKLSPVYDEHEKTGKKSNLKQKSYHSEHPPENVPPVSKETSCQEEGDGERVVVKPSRRSAREKRSKQADTHETQATTTGPNKISVRGNADPFVLRRTEAQELAFLTRTNTQKNKGGAVFPQARLIKLACEDPVDDEDGTNGSVIEHTRQGRLRWREILAEYSEAVNEPVSELSELSEHGNVMSEGIDEFASIGLEREPCQPKPPAPCDTPSKPKPKIRRLRPPRTAVTASQPEYVGPVPAIEDDKKSCDVEDTESSSRARSAAIRKRSRIATPAKKQLEFTPAPLEFNDTSLMSQRSTASQTSSASTERTGDQGKRRTTMSRLPAPSTTLSLSQSKETAPTFPGLSSPPKKSVAPTPNAITGLQPIKTFGPQLSFGNKGQNLATQDEDGTLPGLMSPAKKARSRRLLAGGVELNAGEAEVNPGVTDRPSLSSPAKKRSSRQIVG